MKLYIKTDENWLITESSSAQYDKKEKATVIEVTETQFEKIANQYDTKVVDWKITSQTKWENAQKLEDEKAKEEAERQAREAAEAETTKPTE